MDFNDAPSGPIKYSFSDAQGILIQLPALFALWKIDLDFPCLSRFF